MTVPPFLYFSQQQLLPCLMVLEDFTIFSRKRYSKYTVCNKKIKSIPVAGFEFDYSISLMHSVPTFPHFYLLITRLTFSLPDIKSENVLKPFENSCHSLLRRKNTILYRSTPQILKGNQKNSAVYPGQLSVFFSISESQSQDHNEDKLINCNETTSTTKKNFNLKYLEYRHNIENKSQVQINFLRRQVVSIITMFGCMVQFFMS